jgi:voltage-gated potassium channel
MIMAEMDPSYRAVHAERWKLLRTVDRMLDGPLIVLSFVWLGILVIELAGGSDSRLDVLFYAIWATFIVEVVLEVVIAPDRAAYLRANWLKIVALLVPALRALRVFTALRFLRAAGATRSASLVRLLTSLNRGMSALSLTLDRTRFVYVVALTALIVFVGAAGMLFFERTAAGGVGVRGLTTYGDALWWTAMVMTTIGTDYFPVTAEGRLLAWGLSVFALGVFSYVTATMASYFLGLGDARAGEGRDAELARELAELRAEMATLTLRLTEKVR